MYPCIAWMVLLLGTSTILAEGGLEPAVGTENAARPRNMPASQGQTGPVPRPTAQDLGQGLSRLKAERDALAMERETILHESDTTAGTNTEQMLQMRQRLNQLLSRLSTRAAQPLPKVSVQSLQPPEPDDPPVIPVPASHKSGQRPGAKKPEEHPHDPDDDIQTESNGGLGKPVDALAMAESLFRSADYEGALQAYKLVDPNTLSAANRAGLQYMTASCLRKLGKTDDAATVFREVANSKDDEIMADCARWQLSAISWRRDLETELDQLHKRRQVVETAP